MSKLQNILFSIAAAIVLSVALGNIVASKLVPTYEMPARSYLEGREYQGFPELSRAALADGQFQDQFEQFVSDSVPKQQDVMLANAALQRLSISLAAKPFGYDAYPTFYGSSYAFSSEHGSVCMLPLSQSSDSANYDAIAEKLNNLASKHQDMRWRMALVDRASISNASPVHDYIASPVDYDYMTDVLLSKLSGNIPYIDLSNSDTEQYYQLYFKTDHHWQVWGALDAYYKVMESFGEEPNRQYQRFVAFEGPFYGSYARSGLYPFVSDSVDDVIYDHSELKVSFNGEKQKLEDLCFSFSKKQKPYEKPDRFSNVYADYYHGDPALIKITNRSTSSQKSLLIIGDSFTNNCERFYAEHYHTVYVLDPRKYEKTIEQFLEKHPVDDALFLLSRDTLAAQSFMAAIQ